MKQPKKRRYLAPKAFPITVPGYQFTVYGITFVCIDLFLVEGAAVLKSGSAKQPAELLILKNARPELMFFSNVINYGKAGPTIGSMTFSLSWKGTVLVGSRIDSDGILAFTDAFSEDMYRLANQSLDKLNITELEKLAGVKSLAPISQWDGIPNDYEPVVSTAPNPLNKKQGIADAKLPVTFTVIGLASPDKKYFLAFKLQTNEGSLRAYIEFVYQSDPKSSCKVLKVFDVTDQVPDGLPFLYFTYWLDYYAVPKAPLEHVLLSPIDGFHCTVFGQNVPYTTIVFNMIEPQTYQGNTLTPMYAQFGMLPSGCKEKPA